MLLRSAFLPGRRRMLLPFARNSQRNLSNAVQSSAMEPSRPRDTTFSTEGSPFQTRLDGDEKSMAAVVKDAFLEEAVCDTRSIPNSLAEMEEILGGYDELTLRGVVDKMQFMCYGNLTHWNHIQTLSLARVHALLDIARVPDRNRPKELDALRVCLRNVLLVIVQHMSYRELASFADRIGWRCYQASTDQIRDMLRVWVQQPDCTLFTQPPFCEQLTAHHLMRVQDIANHLPFHFEKEIHMMPIEKLRLLLQQQFQSVQGTHEQLARRLIAYQEFVMYEVFHVRDARTYLQNHYWVSKLDRFFLPDLRRRCLLHLRHPQFGRHVPNTTEIFAGRAALDQKRQQLRKSTGPVVEAPPVDKLQAVRLAHEEMRELSERLCRINPRLLRGGGEELLAEQAAVLDPIENILLHSIERPYSILDEHLRPDVKIDRAKLLNIAPIFLRYKQEVLWNLKREVLYRNARFDFWKMVSTVAALQYGVHIRPEAARVQIHRQQVLQFAVPFRKVDDSPWAALGISTEGVTSQLLNQTRMLTAFEMHNLSVEQLRECLKERQQPIEGDRPELLHRLAIYQEYLVEQCTSQWELEHFLRRSYCRLPASVGEKLVDDLRKRAIALLRYPPRQILFSGRSTLVSLEELDSSAREMTKKQIGRAFRMAKMVLRRRYGYETVRSKGFAGINIKRPDEQESTEDAENSESLVNLIAPARPPLRELPDYLTHKQPAYTFNTSKYLPGFWAIVAGVASRRYNVNLATRDLVALWQEYLSERHFLSRDALYQGGDKRPPQKPLDLIGTVQRPLFSRPAIEKMDDATLLSHLRDRSIFVDPGQHGRLKWEAALMTFQKNQLMFNLSHLQILRLLSNLPWTPLVSATTNVVRLVDRSKTHLRQMLCEWMEDPLSERYLQSSPVMASGMARKRLDHLRTFRERMDLEHLGHAVVHILHVQQQLSVSKDLVENPEERLDALVEDAGEEGNQDRPLMERTLFWQHVSQWYYRRYRYAVSATHLRSVWKIWMDANRDWPTAHPLLEKFIERQRELVIKRRRLTARQQKLTSAKRKSSTIPKSRAHRTVTREEMERRRREQILARHYEMFDT